MISEKTEIILQVNGKLRDKITVPRDTAKADLEAIARKNTKIQKFTAGKELRKVIVVPNKIVNFVVK